MQFAKLTLDMIQLAAEQSAPPQKQLRHAELTARRHFSLNNPTTIFHSKGAVYV
jgi:hypothetical protein